jgi:aerobic-type carbon monoxide dehydrogenase small subunit (CoxS/CutS family)
MSPADTANGASSIVLRVNGEEIVVRAALHDTLLTVVRDQLQQTAAKRGCNQGVCGACTVEIDGRTARACLTLAHACVGAEVRTLEGVQDDPAVAALQDAFTAEQAFQCGFCTPGMLMSARALLEHNRCPDESQIRTALSGNLCRCTGYVKIVAAVRSAAGALREEEAAS